MPISVDPIGFVRAGRENPEDDYWGASESVIELVPTLPAESLAGLEQFSHAEILFHFHMAAPEKIVTGARHPRNNKEWPAIGIFSQRGKNRPNRLGTTICRILGREGTRLRVAELDAIDGTPVLDIKPVMREFLPRTEVTQPAWVGELMSE